MSELAEEFAKVINRSSRENISNTPDFIIGEFLESVLVALEEAINKRDNWYGKKLEISMVELDEVLDKIASEKVKKEFEVWYCPKCNRVSPNICMRGTAEPHERDSVNGIATFYADEER